MRRSSLLNDEGQTDQITQMSDLGAGVRRKKFDSYKVVIFLRDKREQTLLANRHNNIEVHANYGMYIYAVAY